MGRHATEHAPLPDGRTVGYSLKRRGDYFRAVFPDPADPGRYLERSTGATTKADAYPAAAQLILAAYAPTVPRDQRRVSWDEVLTEIEATATVRPATREDYRSAVNVLRAAVETDGPHDVTPEVAARFKRVYAAGTFRRGKAEDARAYTRSPNTVRAALRKLSALWGKHLRELGYARSNPWDDVTPPPAVRRKPAVPDDATVSAFFSWLDRRYKGWRLPRLFCEVKALAGCRTLDLCSLRSDQLRGGRLVFDADRAKGRAERSVPLPADLAAALEKVKGPGWLWERYATELPKPREGRRPFDPLRLKWFFTRTFAAFNAGRPGEPKLRPHDLRRRAITLMTAATQSVDATAQAVGVGPATARRYYLDAQRAFDSDALFTKLAGVLRPPAEPGGKG